MWHAENISTLTGMNRFINLTLTAEIHLFEHITEAGVSLWFSHLQFTSIIFLMSQWFGCVTEYFWQYIECYLIIHMERYFFFGTKCEQQKQRNELTSLKQTKQYLLNS